jgi:HD-GYP domain-containing protein (c-di-GMP phosphodiesterase class II)
MKAGSDLQTQQEKDKKFGTRVLHAWFGAFKYLKLYTPDHPSSRDAAGKLVANLEDIFREKLEFIISNADGLFIINDLFFIEESLAHYELLKALEDHDIKIVSFLPGINPSEITEFNKFLHKKETTANPLGFSSDHIKASATHIEENSLQIKQSDGRKYRPESFLTAAALYDEWMDTAEKTFSKLLEEQSISLGDLGAKFDKLFDSLHHSPTAFSILLSTTPVSNLHLQHSVNTMIMALYIGQQLAYDSPTLKILGTAALLHDIGRLLLPNDFTTGYRLNESDKEFIRLHTRDGASFLAGVTGLPMTIVRASLEHHIGYDGIGYPEFSKNQKPHFFSQIIALADFASWRTVSENYYHKPIPTHRLIRTIIRRAGSQFDPFLVKMLIPLFGLYPPGMKVKLSNGIDATVVETNIRNVKRPLVATLKNDGTWSTHWLGKLSPKEGESFELSIIGARGVETDFEPFLSLLSENKESIK